MAKYAGSKAKLNPWGNQRPLGSSGIARVGKSGNVGRGRSSPALNSMPITRGLGPAEWWIVGAKRKSPTAPTSANTARHNAIVSRAFAKAGYT